MAKIGGLSSIRIYAKRVVDAVEHEAPSRLRRCAMMVESAAKRSMRSGGGKAEKPSPPGEPPHVQTGTLRSSISHAVSGLTAVAGPTEKYGKYHEFGTRLHPQRPFMRPALRKVQRDMPNLFKDMI